jgi:hypothetical protein
MGNEGHRCFTCKAIWSRGEFTADCRECDGGAMDTPCPICEGRCGNKWVRAVDDSHEYGRGTWVGLTDCALELSDPGRD